MLTNQMIDSKVSIGRNDTLSSVAMRAAVRICDMVNYDHRIVIQPGIIYQRAVARLRETSPHLS